MGVILDFKDNPFLCKYKILTGKSRIYLSFSEYLTIFVSQMQHKRKLQT